MPKLNILHHKSYHPYNADNIARVKRDEALAREQDEENDRRATLADSEARIDRLRKQRHAGGEKRDSTREAEKALEKQLRRLQSTSEGTVDDASQAESSSAAAARQLMPPPAAPPSSRAQANEPMVTNGHINFWSELESGRDDAGAKAMLDKATREQKEREQAEIDALTKTFLAKKGEGIEQGWYASVDGLSDAQRREPVDARLERTFKDESSKKSADPLALVHAYLDRRDQVRSGSAPKEDGRGGARGRATPRERYVTPVSQRGGQDASVSVPSLLPPKHRRDSAAARQPPPGSSATRANATASSSTRSTARSPSTSSPRDVRTEARERESSERARAQALIAKRRAEREKASVTDTPRTDVTESEYGDQYNAAETRAAHRREQAWQAPPPQRQRPSAQQSWSGMRRQRDRRTAPHW